MLTSLSVELDAHVFNALSLFASANGVSVEAHAKSLIQSYCRESMGSETMMANVGRALVSGRRADLETPDPLAKTGPFGTVEVPKAKAPKAPKAPKEPKCKADGLPVGVYRATDGVRLTSSEVHRTTLSATDVADMLGVPKNVVHEAVKCRAVIPYVQMGRAPRFSEANTDEIRAWAAAPRGRSRGRMARDVLCSCGRYLSKQGVRMHRRHCKPYQDDNDRESMIQR